MSDASQRLVLRRGTVVETPAWDGAGEQPLVVEVDGVARRATGDVALHGRAEVGDDVVVNAQAVELALGSGGADILHVNLTRGLGGSGVPGAHVMKLNYSSLQHAVLPVEEQAAGRPHDTRPGAPVAVFGLHGQLAPIAWALGQARPGARLGYVQTAGGALPGGHSRVVRDLAARGLLAGHLTAGPCYGGTDGEAITTIGAIDHGVAELGWDAVVCGPGPGILGSGSRLGHGGMIALDTAHAALALGCEVVLTARMSSGDPRERHQGLSHHTRTVLDLLLSPVTCVVPEDAASTDLDGYAASGLPARTMGRSLHEDPLFFAAALAAGSALAAKLRSA